MKNPEICIADFGISFCRAGLFGYATVMTELKVP
jgi:hypothetical protein